MKRIKNGKKPKTTPPLNVGAPFMGAPPDVLFDMMPVSTICQSIQMLINNLDKRGVGIYDFDNKDKAVKQLKIIGSKVFFLTAKEEHNG